MTCNWERGSLWLGLRIARGSPKLCIRFLLLSSDSPAISSGSLSQLLVWVRRTSLRWCSLGNALKCDLLPRRRDHTPRSQLFRRRPSPHFQWAPCVLVLARTLYKNNRKLLPQTPAMIVKTGSRRIDPVYSCELSMLDSEKIAGHSLSFGLSLLAPSDAHKCRILLRLRVLNSVWAIRNSFPTLPKNREWNLSYKRFFRLCLTSGLLTLCSIFHPSTILCLFLFYSSPINILE